MPRLFREPVTISVHRDGTPRTAARWVTVPDYCTPIIDQTTWLAVQERQNHFTRHRHMTSTDYAHPRRSNSRYLLSGIAYCARCGSPLSGHTSPQKNGNKSEAYICGKSVRNPGQCQRNRIPRPFFEKTVIQFLIEHILQPQNMQAAYWFAKELEAGRVAELDLQRQEIVKRLANTRRQLGNVAKALAEHGPSKTILQTLDHHEHRETELLTDLEKLDQQINATIRQMPPAELERRIRALRHILNTTPDDEIKRAILRGTISKITVQRDGDTLRGEITYFYPPPYTENSGYNGNESPDVQSCHDPPGAQRYIHIMGYVFLVKSPAS